MRIMDIESTAPQSNAAQKAVHGDSALAQKKEQLQVVREENKLLKEKLQRLTISSQPSQTRQPSLDVCRGLATAVMIIVKFIGNSVPVMNYAPWDGINFADFGPPIFLFLAGVSTALAHGSNQNKISATGMALRRSVWLFGLGILLEGGFFHGRDNLSYGIDTKAFRVFGTLQRIAVAYFCTSLCEIWAPGYRDSGVLSKKYYIHWAMTALVPAASAAVLYGLHVPDWSFPLKTANSTSNIYDNDNSNLNPCITGDIITSSSRDAILNATTAFIDSTESASRIILRNAANLTCSGMVTSLTIAGETMSGSITNVTYGTGPVLGATSSVAKVICGVRGFWNTGPACNAAAHIDRLVLGMNHLNPTAWYKRLPVCRENLYREIPDWCSAPFESEGILTTLSGTATSLFGLHFGHVMVQNKQHLTRLWSWTLPSASLVIMGMTLHNAGLSFNRQLYSFSYMCFTAGTAGTLLSSVYLVEANGWTRGFSELLQLIGRHSLLLFGLLQCDVLQTLIQGFYHKCPQNNVLSYLRNHHVLHRVLQWLERP